VVANSQTDKWVVVVFLTAATTYFFIQLGEGKREEWMGRKRERGKKERNTERERETNEQRKKGTIKNRKGERVLFLSLFPLGSSLTLSEFSCFYQKGEMTKGEELI
jgi:hypothetical protein